MRTYKAVISYDGTDYHGWQRQPEEKTVQSTLEDVLGSFGKSRVKVMAASRTDSGVHAEGQVVHFKMKTRLSVNKLKKALNAVLPKDIAVKSLQIAKDSFHACYHAKSKFYRYVIYTGRDKPIFDAPYMTCMRDRLDVHAMKQAARFLIGRHDFTSFSQRTGKKRSRIRRVDRLLLKKRRNRLEILVRGNGFLRNMIRVIVGTLTDVGSKKLEPRAVKAILKGKNRLLAGPTAKAQGLTLVKVYY